MADVYLQGESGVVIGFDLPLHPTITDKVKKGHLRRVHEDGTLYTEQDRPDVPAAPTSRPNVNATKAEWVGWAVVNGEPIDAAEALTKADLIEKYGTPAAPTETDDDTPAPEAPEPAADAAPQQ